MSIHLRRLGGVKSLQFREKLFQRAGIHLLAKFSITLRQWRWAVGEKFQIQPRATYYDRRISTGVDIRNHLTSHLRVATRVAAILRI